MISFVKKERLGNEGYVFFVGRDEEIRGRRTMMPVNQQCVEIWGNCN